MSLPYKNILIFGASSGIGWALAKEYFNVCDTVIVTARREDRLKELCAGHPNAHYVVHDITDIAGMESFAKDILAKFPQIDAVCINSGIQRGFDFAKPETMNLENFEEELTTNYISYMYIFKYFLPHLIAKPKSAMICVSSGLAFLPIPRAPSYCASKAALHHLLMSMRFSLRNTSVQVIEIFPPAVQTEFHMHDMQHRTDVQTTGGHGITLEAFTEEAWEGILKGEDEIPVAGTKERYDKIERPRIELFEGVKKRFS